MWVLASFVILTTFFIYFSYKYIYADWKGNECDSNEITYQYKLLSSNKDTAGLLVGIGGPSDYKFTFKKASRYDRLFNLLGISVNQQIESRECDERVYVVFSNKKLQKLITENESIIEAIRETFNYDEYFDCYVKEICCKSGRLWVKFKVGAGFKEYYVTTLAEMVIPMLTKISDELSLVQVGVGRK